jgi:hypothetical protein
MLRERSSSLAEPFSGSQKLLRKFNYVHMTSIMLYSFWGKPEAAWCTVGLAAILSLEFVSFCPRLGIKWKVDFEINTVETSVSVICSSSHIYLRMSRDCLIFQSFNSCHCKQLRILMPYHSCLTLCDVNKMYTLWHHDFTSRRTNPLFSLFYYLDALAYIQGRKVCVHLFRVSVRAWVEGDFITAATSVDMDTQSFCMCSLPFCVPS